MLVYTDSPSFAENLLGARPGWADPASIPEARGAADAALRRALLSDRTTRVARLPDEGIWTRLVLVESAPSSQLDALARTVSAESGLPDRTLCLAGSGEGFRGQRERRWSALAGNLHLCAYLSLGITASRAATGCIVLPVLAALDCVDESLPETGRAGIKWVNDILVDGRKVAGALTRTRCRGDRITDLTVGIGLNVEARPPVERDPFVPEVACLREMSPNPGSCTLARTWRILARNLGRRCQDLREGRVSCLVDEYRRRSLVIGRKVRILADPLAGGEEELLARGRVSGIEDDLALRLEEHEPTLARGRLVLEDQVPEALAGRRDGPRR